MSFIASKLEKQKVAILQNWEEEIRNSSIKARTISKSILRDHLPKFIDYIISALRNGISEVQQEMIEYAQHLGIERAEYSNFTLEEAVGEYNVLRKVIFKSLEDNGSAIPHDERDVIYELLNMAISKTATEFSKAQFYHVEENRATLLAIINSMPAAVWVAKAQDGEVYLANSNSENILEKKRKFVSDFDAHTIFYKDGRPCPTEEWPITRSLKKGEVISNEVLMFKRRDGSYGYLRLDSTPVYNEERQLIAAVAIGTDISESKEVEKALRSSEERFRLIFHNAPVGMAEVSIPDRKFININPKYCEMLGYSEDELRKLDVYAITHPDDGHDDSVIFKEMNEGKIRHFRREKRYIKKDGSVIWVEISVNTFDSYNGNPRTNIAVAMDITDRKLAEETLHITEERFRLATSLSKVGVWELDLTSMTTWRNSCHDELFGYVRPVPTWTERTFLEHVHPDDLKTLSLCMEKARRTPGKFSWEFRVIWPDSTVHWLVALGETIAGSDGNPLRMLGTNYEVTELKLSEQKLEDLSKRLQLITDIQPLLIGQLDKNLHYIFANQAYLKWFNLSRDEIIGHSIFDVLGTEAARTLVPYLERVLSGEKVIFETAMNYRYAGKKYVQCTYSPGLNAQGKVDSIFVSVVDLTEQRRTLEALKRSEEEFRNLLNALPQLAWIADKDGSIYWYNERWFEYTGTTWEEMKGWGWTKVHHPDYFLSVVEKYKEHMKTGEIWEDTFPLRRTDGEWRWFLSRAIPIRDSAGKISRWLGTNTDVTEQKEVLDALHGEKALRDKFVSTLTHDLRTPLTASMMSAEFLKRKTGDPNLKNFADRISENLNRANMMIEDLLDANKLRAGQEITPDLHEMDFIETVQQALEDLAAIHGPKFVLEAPQKLPVILDPHGLRRIVENLCTNAVKYGAPDGTITIKVIKGENDLLMCVHNEGNPLAIIDRERLFQPFQRGTAASTAGKKGWGIGLTIVKGITDSLKGDVSVETTETGTTFNIRLPLNARTDEGQMELH